jgi:hypothetical protein
MPAIMSGDPKHVGSAIGDRRDAQHRVSRSLFGRRSNPDRYVHHRPTAAVVRASLRRSNKPYQATAHTWPLRWQYPPYLRAMPANSHTKSRRPFFSGVFPFSVSKGPVGRRCGNVQEKINGKLNYPDQYFVGLVPGQRPDRANSSAPSIWRSDN